MTRGVPLEKGRGSGNCHPVSHLGSRALVVLRVPRGASAPPPARIRAAIAADRERLRLPPADGDIEYRLAGPYAVEVDGQGLDEYVAWEI